MTRRILAILTGAAILVLIGLRSIGLALVAPAGMWAAYAVLRERGRSYTRRAGWVGAVLACSLVTAGFIAFTLMRAPAGFFDSVRREADLRRERQPSAIEQALRRASTATPQQAMVEKKSRQLVRSTPFLWWMTIMTVGVGSVVLGTFAGSAGWGATTLILFGIRGGVPRTPPG